MGQIRRGMAPAKRLASLQVRWSFFRFLIVATGQRNGFLASLAVERARICAWRAQVMGALRGGLSRSEMQHAFLTQSAA